MMNKGREFRLWLLLTFWLSCLPITYFYAICIQNNGDTWDNTKEAATHKPITPHELKTVQYDPALILHIGPHKTGTSTIQCELTYFQEDLFSNASVAFIGRTYGDCWSKQRPKIAFAIDTRGLIDKCFKQGIKSSSCQKRRAWDRLENHLEYLSQRNVSVIISDEAFTRMKTLDQVGVNNYQRLFSIFDKYYPGNVHVAIVYRRYHEWLLSIWNENNKPSHGGGEVKKGFRLWPSEGGTMTETFHNYYNKSQLGLHPAESLQQKWSNYSSQIHVLNMHEMMLEDVEKGRGLLSNFLWHTLPSPLAGDTIAALKRQGAGQGVGRPNPSTDIDFELLALKAYEKGYLNSTKSERRQIVPQVEKYLIKYLKEQNNSLADKAQFPMVCLSDSEQRDFLQESIEFERRMHSLSLLKHTESQSEREERQQHEASFWKAVKGNKFCNVDAEKLIQDEMVQNFFRILNENQLMFNEVLGVVEGVEEHVL